MAIKRHRLTTLSQAAVSVPDAPLRPAPQNGLRFAIGAGALAAASVVGFLVVPALRRPRPSPIPRARPKRRPHLWRRRLERINNDQTVATWTAAVGYGLAGVFAATGLVLQFTDVGSTGHGDATVSLAGGGGGAPVGASCVVHW